MTTYETWAIEQLDEALEARQQLRAAYSFKPLDFELIGRLKADQRFHLDVAQVYAALAAAHAPAPGATSPAPGAFLPSYGGGHVPTH